MSMNEHHNLYDDDDVEYHDRETMRGIMNYFDVDIEKFESIYSGFEPVFSRR